MSQWTHVIATIYYHSIVGQETEDLFNTANPWTLWKKVERGEMTEDEYHKLMNNVNVPSGSEGPLDVFESKEYLNPDNEFTRNFRCVTLYGDLRDYGGDKGIRDIINWWKKTHEKMFVRQSTLQIMDEWSKEIILVNCWGKGNLIEEDDGNYKHDYVFSIVSIPRVGRRKNPKNYIPQN